MCSCNISQPMAAGQIAARKEKDLKVSKFIEKLKPYSDFELKATVHSDNVLLVGVLIKE